MRAVLGVLLAMAAVPAAAALRQCCRPDFTTRGAVAGKVFTLHLKEQLRHGPVVLYFFPAAFTSGCSAEARAFAEKIDAFRAAGARVIGMSADPVDKLAAFPRPNARASSPSPVRGPRSSRAMTSRSVVRSRGAISPRAPAMSSVAMAASSSSMTI